jgi:hypothetical protein
MNPLTAVAPSTSVVEAILDSCREVAAAYPKNVAPRVPFGVMSLPEYICRRVAYRPLSYGAIALLLLQMGCT